MAVEMPIPTISATASPNLLIGNLAHVPQLKVKSRSSVFRYKGKDVDAQKAGNELGVSALVSGRVTSRGDSIEVSAELIDVRDNTEIWEHHYSGKGADIISLQMQIAGDIAGKLRSKLSSSEKQQVTRQGTQNPEAYELYLKGRYAWNNRSSSELEKAISYFNQAITKDPSYALAYSGLADAYSVLPNFGGNPSEDYPKSNARRPQGVGVGRRPWLILMPFWAATRCSTTGILRGERRSSRSLSNSTPTMPLRISGTRTKLA